MNIGERITVLADETKLSAGLEGLRGVPVEAKLVAHGSAPLAVTWWQWQIHNSMGTGFIRADEEGRTWLRGWGEDKKAVLLLVRSAA